MRLRARLNTILERLMAQSRQTSRDTEVRFRMTLLRHIDSGCHDGAELMSRVSRRERILLAVRLQHLVDERLIQRRLIRSPPDRPDQPARHKFLITWRGLNYLAEHSR